MVSPAERTESSFVAEIKKLEIGIENSENLTLWNAIRNNPKGACIGAALGAIAGTILWLSVDALVMRPYQIDCSNDSALTKWQIESVSTHLNVSMMTSFEICEAYIRPALTKTLFKTITQIGTTAMMSAGGAILGVAEGMKEKTKASAIKLYGRVKRLI